MELQVERLFSPDVKHQAALLAGTTAEQLISLGSFENYVFEFPHPTGPRILRITHSSHRSLAQVLSELYYVHYLANNSVRVAAPIPNTRGNLADKIAANDGSYFIAIIFCKAPGVGKGGFELEPAILESWGRITGQMHRLAKGYRPAEGLMHRYQWYEDPLLINAATDERLDIKARGHFQEIVSKIKMLPAYADNFGLIHTDLHQGNFFVHEQQVVAFDFDDCCYQYFVHDIAINLYYALWKGYKGLGNKEFVPYFLKHFMKGYEQEHLLPNGWLKQLPLFLDLRNFVIYAVLTQKIDPNDASPKYLETMDRCRKLATGEEVLFDFELDY